DRIAFKSASVCYTYSDLAAEALRHAAILRDLGVKRGDRVAVLTTPRAESAMLFIAMNMVGAIWICLNPQYRLREFQYTIE
ncbi:acyl--CoA ligase, partial [Bacillus sp. NTK074B]|nr:acyl--CoA ligase [Bacillus sp. NTK074B]